MLTVLFSGLPEEIPRETKGVIWDIASFAISHLGYRAAFTKGDKLANQLMVADALVVFPGIAEDEKAVKSAKARGLPVIPINTLTFEQATLVLSRELLEIEKKKNP